jgi:uncharacterized protein YndB with AHSA1/START domain
MSEQPIELTRVFDAPRERIYQAFTDPDEFARWYGPVEFPVHRRTRRPLGRVAAIRDGQ